MNIAYSQDGSETISGTYRVVHKTRPFDDDEFLAEWRNFYGSLPIATLYQSPEWNKCWWQAFAEPEQDCKITSLYEGDQLVALAPLYLDANQNLHLLGSSNFASDYAQLLWSPELPFAREVLIREIFQIPGWQRLSFRHVASDHPDLASLEGLLAKESKGKYICQRVSGAPSLLAVDSSEFIAARKKNSMKRACSKLGRLGSVTFERICDRSEINSLLPQFFSQHIQRREILTDKSQFHDPRQKEFYRSLVNMLDPESALHFSVLRLNDRPIAFHFGFLSCSRLMWYKPTFDPELSEYSPGKVLLWHLLTEAEKLELEELDFTVGDEAFKYQFSNIKRDIYHLRAFRKKADYLQACLHAGLKSLRAVW